VGTGRPTGRPSVYSEEVAHLICARVSAGETLKKVCAADDIPEYSTVLSWVFKDYGGFASLYARAKEERAEVWSEEIVEIADASDRDFIEGEEGERRFVDHEHIQRSRLRIDTRKWIMSKLLPKKFGDRTTTELANADGNPLVVYNVTKTDSGL
jgi:hypothetical protein